MNGSRSFRSGGLWLKFLLLRGRDQRERAQQRGAGRGAGPRTWDPDLAGGRGFTTEPPGRLGWSFNPGGRSRSESASAGHRPPVLGSRGG